MPERFVVPQFIDVESKIFGPITVRQFIIMLVDFGIIFLLYKLFDFVLFIIIGLPVLALGFVLAFIKINGQPFHYFVLNLVQTLKRPSLRLWDKELSDAELRELIKEPEKVVVARPPTKAPPAGSRLSELSLVVNTGGVYKPEEW